MGAGFAPAPWQSAGAAVARLLAPGASVHGCDVHYSVQRPLAALGSYVLNIGCLSDVYKSLIELRPVFGRLIMLLVVLLAIAMTHSFEGRGYTVIPAWLTSWARDSAWAAATRRWVPSFRSPLYYLASAEGTAADAAAAATAASAMLGLSATSVAQAANASCSDDDGLFTFKGAAMSALLSPQWLLDALSRVLAHVANGTAAAAATVGAFDWSIVGGSLTQRVAVAVEGACALTVAGASAAVYSLLVRLLRCTVCWCVCCGVQPAGASAAVYTYSLLVRLLRCTACWCVCCVVQSAGARRRFFLQLAALARVCCWWSACLTWSWRPEWSRR